MILPNRHEGRGKMKVDSYKYHLLLSSTPPLLKKVKSVRPKVLSRLQSTKEWGRGNGTPRDSRDSFPLVTTRIDFWFQFLQNNIKDKNKRN